MNSPAALTALNNMPSTDTPAGQLPPADKYIVVNIFYLKKIILLRVLSDKTENCVAGFLIDTFLTPLSSF